MKRRSLAVALVTCGLLAPAAAPAASAAQGTAPAASSAPAGSAPAGPRVAPAPDAPTVDRCAARAKQVTRLKRRLRVAETKRGEARTRRRLNAARRSLGRCRAHKPAPTSPAPRPTPAPGPPLTPAPTPLPRPVPSPNPEPGEPALIVNGSVDGVIAPTAALLLQAVDLPVLPEGAVYHFAVRTPIAPFPPPAGGWGTCQRLQPEDVTFTGTRGETTMAPGRPWCSGAARAFVWVGAPGEEYGGTNLDVAVARFTISPAVVPTAG